MERTTPRKKRSRKVYNQKIEKLRKWYERLQTLRNGALAYINPHTKVAPKRKLTHDLEWYIARVGKVVEKN